MGRHWRRQHAVQQLSFFWLALLAAARRCVLKAGEGDIPTALAVAVSARALFFWRAQSSGYHWFRKIT